MTRRILLSYLAITLFVLLVLELPLAIVYQDRELDRLTSDVEHDASVLATIYVEVLEGEVSPDPAPASGYSIETNSRVVVVDANGISVIDTAGDTDRDFSTRPEFTEALDGRTASGTRTSTTLGTDLLFVAVPVASGGTIFGAVRITMDPHEVTERVHRFWLGLAAIAAVVLVAVAMTGWTIARSVTRPIRQIQATATRFADGDLTRAPGDPHAPAELIALEHSMNTMASRLHRTLEQQREFVADASHQLRTPLTALRLQLENLQTELDDPSQAEAVEASIGEIDRLTHLVSDLLQLARSERTAIPAPTNLSVLTRDRIDTWGAMVDDADQEIDFDAPAEAVWALAIPGAIEQVIDNLIDNAIAASPAGGVIAVRLTRGELMHRLSVADSGPGMDEVQRTRALERFWRADTAVPGTGLGLAIAKTLAESCGGSLTLDQNHPVGLIAQIDLPVATQPRLND